MKLANHYKLTDDSKQIIRAALIAAQVKLEDSIRHLEQSNLQYLAKDNKRVLDKVNAAIEECSVTKLEWVYEEDK